MLEDAKAVKGDPMTPERVVAWWAKSVPDPAGLDLTGDAAKKYKASAGKYPTWRWVVRVLLLIQPSSAAAERVFSLMRRNFNSENLQSKLDIIEATLMVQYNERVAKRKVKRKRPDVTV